MLRFFKHIRLNLFGTGNIGRYLKYALGEILLVVLGILIAVWINNWNEERKERILEQAILLDLKEEFQLNLKQLNQKIAMRNTLINGSIDVLDYIDSAQYDIDLDTLILRLRYLGLDPTFDPIQNDLISSGNIRLIQRKELNKLLSNWPSNVQSLQEMELQWQRLKTDLNIPFQIRLGIVRNMVDEEYKAGLTPVYITEDKVESQLVIGKTKKSLTAKTILMDNQLESIMANAIAQNHSTNIQSQALKYQIVDILRLMNEEIRE